MKFRDYKLMSDKELEKALEVLKLELIKSHGAMEMARVQNRKGEKVRGRNLQPRIRKEIARILTLQKQRNDKERRD